METQMFQVAYGGNSAFLNLAKNNTEKLSGLDIWSEKKFKIRAHGGRLAN